MSSPKNGCCLRGECRPVIQLHQLGGGQARERGLQEFGIERLPAARLACPLGLPQHGLQQGYGLLPGPCILCIQRQLHRHAGERLVERSR